MTETFDPQDVLARLDALESGLDISQLPLRALMNTLETNWQPDSSTLLQPASIGSDLLEPGAVTAIALDPAALILRGTRGVQALSWASGAALSSVATVTHGAGATPNDVQATINGTGGPDLIVVQAFNIGPTTFQLQGGFRAGTAGAILNIPCGWAAFL